MKLLYSGAVGLLGLVACTKEQDTAPHLEAAFTQPFPLRYAQSASLPDQQAPELTVTDVLDQRCRPAGTAGRPPRSCAYRISEAASKRPRSA